MEDNNLWIFPANIKFEDVPMYMHMFMESGPDQNHLVFDLTNTTDIHSSFIGFLLHAKSTVASKGGTLKILTSDTIERIFNLLRVNDHFTTEIEKAEIPKVHALKNGTVNRHQVS